MKIKFIVYRICLLVLILESLIGIYLGVSFVITYSEHMGYAYGLKNYFFPKDKIEGVIDLIFWITVMITCIGLWLKRKWSWFFSHIIGIPFIFFYLLILKRQLYYDNPIIDDFAIFTIIEIMFLLYFANLEMKNMFTKKNFLFLFVGIISFSMIGLKLKKYSFISLLTDY